MQAVVIPRIGGPEVLEVRELPTLGRPPPGTVRVEVAAAGINFADVMLRIGMYPGSPAPPMVPGLEIAGRVSEVGEGVTHLRCGDRVLAVCKFGGQAAEVLVPSDRAMRIPEGVTLEEAAATPINYLTAWHCLRRLGNLQRDEIVVIPSVAGGVGLAALQICELVGARAIGLAGSEKHGRVSSPALLALLPSGSPDLEQCVMDHTEGRGAHHVIDTAGGRSLRRSYRLVRPTGRLYCLGISGMAGPRRSLLRNARELFATPLFHALSLVRSNRGVFGVDLGALWDDPTLATQLGQIVALVERRALRPTIHATLSFREAAQAHTILHDRANVGKVLLRP